MANAGWTEEIVSRLYAKTFQVDGYDHEVKMGIYADDVLFGRDQRGASPAHKNLNLAFGLKNNTPHFLEKEFSMHAEPIETYHQDGNQMNAIFTHQGALAETLVQRYKDEIGQKGPFKKVEFPTLGKTEMLDKEMDDMARNIGETEQST